MLLRVCFKIFSFESLVPYSLPVKSGISFKSGMSSVSEHKLVLVYKDQSE